MRRAIDPQEGFSAAKAVRIQASPGPKDGRTMAGEAQNRVGRWPRKAKAGFGADGPGWEPY